MDDKGGFEGRLLHDSNPPIRQTVSLVLCSGLSLPVQLPRPILCSLGLYQDPEASNIPAQRAGGKASGIHRRHPDYGGVRGTSEGGLIYLLENLGFIVHPVKGVTTPIQQIEFLGMQVHSQTLELHFPGQKLKKLRSKSAKLKNLEAPPTAREVSLLLGKLNSVSQAVTLGPLFCRMQRDLAAALDRETSCTRRPASISCSKGGAHLVDRTTDQVEWEELGPVESRIDTSQMHPTLVGEQPVRESAWVDLGPLKREATISIAWSS